MIKTELINHPIAYSILVVGLLTFVAAFFIVWPDRNLERAVIISYAVFYFLWGVFTHKSKQQVIGSLTAEYAFVSILGALILLMLTF
jgi:hypothetical protein